MTNLLDKQTNVEVDEIIANQHPGDRLAIKQSFIARLTRSPYDESAWDWLVFRCSQKPRIEIAATEKIKPVKQNLKQQKQGDFF